MNREIVRDLGNRVKKKEITWETASKEYLDITGFPISRDALRKRYEGINVGGEPIDPRRSYEYENHYGDGGIELQKKIFFNEYEEKTPETILNKFGYNPSKWKLLEWKFGEWEMPISKEGCLTTCITVKAKIKPRDNQNLDVNSMIGEIKELFSKEIKPLKFTKEKLNKELDNNLLLELPPIELHLGKLSCHLNTGENYDSKIAENRFKTIIEQVIQKQRYEKCGKALISIGGDFFNSDNDLDTTTKGTQMHSDTRGEKMFLMGLKLWRDAILSLREEFNQVEVQLVVGNHDKNTSFHLFVALQQAFLNDKKVNFIENYKEVQCYVFKDCCIWTTHGSKNIVATIESLFSEFPLEYGKTKYRELHLGHLHHEMELKEKLGIIPRRLSASCGKDEYEYNERFGKSIQKQQVFIWQGNAGLIDIKMIPFEPVKE